MLDGEALRSTLWSRHGGLSARHSGIAPMSVYDGVAPSFERHRALPEGVPEKIRAAILVAVSSPRPRLLDLGAGTGRIGWCFAEAGDDYVAVDLSLGMLREFARRASEDD